MVEPLVFGVELGGTKTIAVAARGRTIIDMVTVATTDPATTLDAVLASLDTWWDRHGRPEALGLASFGPLQLDPARPRYGWITNTPKPGWADCDLLGYFRDHFEIPLGIETDVAAAGLAEYFWGAAQGCDVAVYVTVGTGIGGGLIVSGKPVHGLMHPELGHVRVRRAPEDDFAGVCPFHGDCLEGLASGPAIAARAGGDPAGLASDHPVWPLVAATLAELVASLMVIVSPQRVMLGGGISFKRAFLLLMIRKRVETLLNGYVEGVAAQQLREIICAPGLADHAGPMGAIAVALNAIGAAQHSQTHYWHRPIGV